MRTGTKFWFAIIVVAIQMFVFVIMALKGGLTDGMVTAFLAAPVAVFIAFGVLNVAASGQAVTTTTTTTDPRTVTTETKGPA